MARSDALGIREYAGLGALAVALALAAWFGLNSPGNDGGSVVPTAVSTAAGAAFTPAPLPGESTWSVAIVRVAPDGKEEVLEKRELPVLALDYTAPPLPELRGTHWRIVAEATFAGSGRSYDVLVRYRGNASLLVNGAELANGIALAAPGALQTRFLARQGSPSQIRLSVDGDDHGVTLAWLLRPSSQGR